MLPRTFEFQLNIKKRKKIKLYTLKKEKNVKIPHSQEDLLILNYHSTF